MANPFSVPQQPPQPGQSVPHVVPPAGGQGPVQVMGGTALAQVPQLIQPPPVVNPHQAQFPAPVVNPHGAAGQANAAAVAGSPVLPPAHVNPTAATTAAVAAPATATAPPLATVAAPQQHVVAPAAPQVQTHAPVRQQTISDADLQAISDLKAAHAAIKSELAKVIIGQSDVIDQILISIFTRSHALLVGVPGLAKTLMISTLAQTLQLSFKRIQFTPDLMPSDITGTEVIYQDQATGERQFKFLKGPIFANIILADEINRTPPKTQSAMLEAMQERKISQGGVDHKLPDPFFVLATQNPVEQEGTYPLPEAQLDRFLFMIYVDYPSAAEERAIMQMASGLGVQKPTQVLGVDDILALQNTVRRMPVSEHVLAYAQRLVAVTRPKAPEALDFCKRWLTWGAGPRASLNLILAAKARAILRGQVHVSADDVAAVALPIFRHRIIPNFAAQSEGVSADDITRKVLDAVPRNKKFEDVPAPRK